MMIKTFKSKNRARLLISSIVLLIVLTTIINLGCSSSKKKDNALEKTEISLRLKWLWYAGWAGELVAMQNDIWKDHGLSVTVEPGGFELDPIKLVASGSDDIGVAGADQVLMAREKEIPLVAFAVQYQVSPVGFVSKEESGITRIEDFQGRKVGVKYGTDVEPIYRVLIANAGLSPDYLEEVPVKFDLSPFFSGVVDVYPGYLTNDLLIPEEHGYKVNTIRALDYGVYVYGNVYFCTERFLSEHPETIKRFLAAITEAWQKALSMPPEEVAALAVKVNKSLNMEHETRVVQSLQPYVVPKGMSFGQMTEEGWTRLFKLLRKQDVIETEFDYSSAFTLTALEAATQ